MAVFTGADHVGGVATPLAGVITDSYHLGRLMTSSFWKTFALASRWTISYEIPQNAYRRRYCLNYLAEPGLTSFTFPSELGE